MYRVKKRWQAKGTVNKSSMLLQNHLDSLIRITLSNTLTATAPNLSDKGLPEI
jgi:hypothetical protein